MEPTVTGAYCQSEWLMVDSLWLTFAYFMVKGTPHHGGTNPSSPHWLVDGFAGELRALIGWDLSAQTGFAYDRIGKTSKDSRIIQADMLDYQRLHRLPGKIANWSLLCQEVRRATIAQNMHRQLSFADVLFHARGNLGNHQPWKDCVNIGASHLNQRAEHDGIKLFSPGVVISSVGFHVITADWHWSFVIMDGISNFMCEAWGSPGFVMLAFGKDPGSVRTGEDWHRCCGLRILHRREEALRLGFQEPQQPSRHSSRRGIHSWCKLSCLQMLLLEHQQRSSKVNSVGICACHFRDVWRPCKRKFTAYPWRRHTNHEIPWSNFMAPCWGDEEDSSTAGRLLQGMVGQVPLCLHRGLEKPGCTRDDLLIIGFVGRVFFMF